MRRIRNILAGCLTLAAGLTQAAADDAAAPLSPEATADAVVMPTAFFGCGEDAACDAPGGCEAPCDAGCEAPCDIAGGCGAPCGLGGCASPCFAAGCEAPCGGCAVPCGCVAPGGCCEGDCAEYGRGGWMEMQKRTLKYGWNGEAGTLCGGCHGGCGQCGGCNGNGGCNSCGGYFAYKLRCLFGVSGGQTHAPGHGYVLPMKRPIYDVSHPYSNMWAAHPITGAAHRPSPNSYRNVYMPTDTTQLGYSYGHVPYWMPRAGMVPPVPVPDAYHNRITVSDRCESGECQYSTEAPTYAAEPTPVAR